MDFLFRYRPPAPDGRVALDPCLASGVGDNQVSTLYEIGCLLTFV